MVIKVSKIDELLKNEKVEWKKLGEVCEIKKGKQYNKKDMLEIAEYPVINGGVSPSGYIEIFNENENTITVSQGGASAGFVNFIETKFWLGAHAFSIKPKIKIIKDFGYNYKFFNRYIFHILKMNQDMLQSSQLGAGIPSISKEKLSSIAIPMTTKESQEKIVKILDKFTNYVSELQTELRARNKQYEYYRDMILSEKYLNKLTKEFYQIDRIRSFGYVKISELCLRQKGINITAEQMKNLDKSDSSVKVFAGGNTTANLLPEEVGIENIINKPSVIVKSRGNIDFEYYDRNFTHKNEMWSYSSLDEEKLNIKFLYCILKNNLKYFKDNAISGKLPQISIGLTDNYKVPLPSIYIQNKVVEVLYRFEELVENSRGLLPEEIEKRQKQYEYYRKKLLTFDENVVEPNRTELLISNGYFIILREACDNVGVNLFFVAHKKLKEVAKCYDGTHQTPKYKDSGVSFISVENIKDIYGSNKYISFEDFNKFKNKAQKGDMFMSRIGDIGTCAIVKDDRDLAYYVTLALIKVNNKIISSKYLKFYIESIHGKRELNKRVLHNANPIKINLSDIGELKILLPSIEVQEYVVGILDRFESLTSNISEGLPKEIDLRQKEYEYYREKLLDFPKN